MRIQWYHIKRYLKNKIKNKIRTIIYIIKFFCPPQTCKSYNLLVHNNIICKIYYVVLRVRAFVILYVLYYIIYYILYNNIICSVCAVRTFSVNTNDIRTIFERFNRKRVNHRDANTSLRTRTHSIMFFFFMFFRTVKSFNLLISRALGFYTNARFIFAQWHKYMRKAVPPIFYPNVVIWRCAGDCVCAAWNVC